jgi:site-specific DNA-cytosine methylase
MMAKRFPWIPREFIFSDVAELNSSTRVMLKITRIDVVTAGFPCQGVSINNVARDGFDSEVLIPLLNARAIASGCFCVACSRIDCMYVF